jgi:glycosyltransferase involved in cell wall biosynthesis
MSNTWNARPAVDASDSLSEVTPLLSVVICVRNGRPFLPGLHASLLRLEEPEGGFEVVFVDDQSGDGTTNYLADIATGDRRFRLVRGRGIGLAAARNNGIAIARGRFIALTDADVVPDQDWLVQIERIVNREGVRAVEGVVAPWSGTGSPLIRNVQNQDGGRFMTANMVYEKKLLDELGGFDEDFRPPCFLEDTDLAYRTLDHGVEIPFRPAVRVRHRDVPLSPSGALNSLGGLEWMALVARKHPKRYRRQLRRKIQTLRPGDLELLLSLPLLINKRRASLSERAIGLALLGIAVRRVLRVAQISQIPRTEQLPWFAVALASPGLRAFHLVRGWIRFRKVAL